MDNRELGALRQAGDRWSLTFKRRVPHAPPKVWRAVTEPEHLRVWFPSDIEGERTEGAKLRFVFREDEGPTIAGEMLRFEPPSLLEMRWGDELIRIEITPDSDGSLITFVNTFDELGKAARDGAGWHGCLDLLLSDLSGDAREFSTHGWKELEPLYVASLGPEASTVGPPEGHRQAT